jgi:hypothetical protein
MLPLCLLTWYHLSIDMVPFVYWHGTVVSIDMVLLCLLTWYRGVYWHGTVVSFDMLPLCLLTWYRLSIDMIALCWLTWYLCVHWHGTVVSIDMLALCLLTWYCCVYWHGTVVSIGMVPLCRLTWYRCVFDTVPFYHNCSKCLVSLLQLFCNGSTRQVNCRLILFLVQPHPCPRKIFPALRIIQFPCSYTENILRVTHA